MIDEIMENKFKNRVLKWLDRRNFFYPGSKILLKLIRLIFNLRGVQILAIGQSHLDACWRWVRKETIRKNYVTFSKALEHIDLFPGFKFSCSSPQYYEWMENYFPEEFRIIKERVKEGRIELLGGMWIEPDMNLINGESMVRQRLYGQRYYLSRFGKMSEVGWLSDTFGYNWQLPQVLVKSGAKYFYTNKMNWNAENKFPLSAFYWKSPDGSKILVYSFPYALNIFVSDPNVGGFKRLCSLFPNNELEFTYDSDFEKIEKLKSKQHIKELGWIYGLGDGGGGPLLEEVIIFKDLVRQGEIKFITALEYFKILEKYGDRLPNWNDELYLEMHQGVYTTHAWIKEANRKAETKLRNLEIFSTLSSIFGLKYPKTESLWKLILFNQFHDILPGSSIPEVYEDSKKDYKLVNDKADEIITKSLQFIIERIDTSKFPRPVIVFNTLNWERAGIVKVPIGEDHCSIHNAENEELPSQIIEEGDKKYLIFNGTIPSLGYYVFGLEKKVSEQYETDLKISEDEKTISIENRYLQVQISKKLGCITSIYHKSLNKEIIAGKANWIQMYEDNLPKDSAWNIDKNYYKKAIALPRPHKIEILERGPILTSVRIHQTYKNSKFDQTIKLYSQEDLLEFNLDLDIREKRKIVKVAFPLNVKTEKFSSEIPFGVISRPTIPKLKSQMGRWEVSAQKWIDLTGEDFGVTLMNSSKYGFNVIGNILKMTIVRTPLYPREGHPLQLWDTGSVVDLGKHSIKYALCIHEGGEQKFSINKAHEFNDPFFVIESSSQAGKIPSVLSFMNIKPKTIILSAFKPFEDREEKELKFILRIYESLGKNTSCKITFSNIISILEVFETDLLEFNHEKIKDHDQNTINIQISKFEIKTLLIKIQSIEG